MDWINMCSHIGICIQREQDGHFPDIDIRSRWLLFFKRREGQKRDTMSENQYTAHHLLLEVIENTPADYTIEFLDWGQALEPTNPNFVIEKAQALAQLGDHQKALELYKQAQTVNAYSSKHNKAVALRGEGFVRIEIGDLDGAERAYRESLKIEPRNKLVRKQRKYIAHLRSGGVPKRAITVATDRVKPWWQFWKR